MWKQLIGQVQELLDLYGSPPPPIPTVRPPDFIYLQPPTLITHQFRDDRCCLLNLEDDPSEDDCYSFVMKDGEFKMSEPGKSPMSKRARKEQLPGKLDDGSSSNAGMEAIWREFPEDLYEAVIARLPISTFFRFRSVCQKWNSLLISSSFFLQCAQLPQTQPWFYTNTGAMYDPVSRKWHHPTLPAIPTKSIILPVAAAGGLVCSLDIDRRSLYVCNPLASSFKELPGRPARVWSRVAVGMSLNEKSVSGGYRIMWVGSDGEYEVYDSTKNSWTCPGSMPACIKMPLSLNFRSQPVTVDRSIYFLRSNPDGLVLYDIETGVWKQFTVPAPLQLCDHTLAEGGGRIMLVGLVTKNAATCVCIWELQKMTLLWKEVDRMPNIWCLEFYGKHIRMSCLGNRGLLMLSLRSRIMNQLVTYDISKKEWVKVPGCVIPHGGKRRWIAAGVAFHPCLAAVA
ncbi:hypothetical protein L6452_21339 [Arctium lappa]|uniref:Uncharacterized protein n=1 Tax=Arctium lappa TaxID=4217 RepID=A0ACB9BFT9_ARCLA|nr:hypothetical protein L6452_21339 [Arctium lappa]